MHALHTQRFVYTHEHASGHPEATTYTHVCTCAQASACMPIRTHAHNMFISIHAYALTHISTHTYKLVVALNSLLKENL